MEALAKSGHASGPVTEFLVETATDDTTVLTLNRKNQEQQVATLVSNDDGAWLIDNISDVPEPS